MYTVHCTENAQLSQLKFVFFLVEIGMKSILINNFRPTPVTVDDKSRHLTYEGLLSSHSGILDAP